MTFTGDDALLDEFGEPLGAVVDGYLVPPGYTPGRLGTCRSCGATIMWATTRSKRPAPLNADGHSHFATCPEASSWRKR